MEHSDITPDLDSDVETIKQCYHPVTTYLVQILIDGNHYYLAAFDVKCQQVKAAGTLPHNFRNWPTDCTVTVNRIKKRTKSHAISAASAICEIENTDMDIYHIADGRVFDSHGAIVAA
jgi:hypothetical protein